MATYVIVHGGWDGGWSWRAIARALQSAGHEVYTATLTGSGERVHLASPEVDLSTHIMDVVNIFRYERLEDVVLVGTSYGGMVITGVAEQVPEQIKQLIYLDAFVPEDGQMLADLAAPEFIAFLDGIAKEQGDGWRIPHIPPADRRTDFLLKASKQPLSVNNPLAAKIKRTFVHFTEKPEDSPLKPIFENMAAKVQQKGWDYHEAPYDHFPCLEYPQEIAQLLIDLID
jgi:pimeloyl-ACP methyl ester carboxylesterase